MSSIIVYSSSGTLLLLLLLSFLSFAMSQSSLYGGLNYIYNSCPSDENNTASGNYMYNVGRLFSQKLYDGGNKSIDYGEYPDKVYGLYLCRFDITGETCKNCIDKATDQLVKECRSNKTAIIWFEECMVRYSNVSFFSTLELYPSVGIWNMTNVTHPDVFNGILNKTFNKAIAMLSASNYGIQNVSISNNETLYSLVQCLPGLSTKDCRACLDDAANFVLEAVEDWFMGRRGGIYLNPSCNMRYELYPFYGDTTPTVAAPAPDTPSNNSSNTGDWESKRKKESRAWIIPVTITAAAIVVVLLSYFLWRMLRKNTRDEEESANSQEVQLIHLRDDRMGNEYSDDALQRENRVESQEFPLFPLGLALEATQHFCDENKLGEGGFGPVYKGILADGSICLLYLLSFVSMVMSQTFPYSHCPRGSNNTASTKFRDNLNNLFNGKLYDERGNSLSYNTTDGEIPDRVYSNYICRFDFSPETCRNCVNDATKNIVEKCNGTQEAVLWYPTCTVRYSYRNFFSTLELVPIIYAWTAGNITRPAQFAMILNQTFNDLIERAPLNPSKYAIHEDNISDFERLYSLAQCTEDLSTEDCGACLKAAFDRVTADSVQGKQGGRVLIPSCFIRYELFRFYGDPYVVGSPGPISQPNEEEINNQEAQITPMSERRMGDERSYDILRRDHQNQTESQDFPVFPLSLMLEVT
ncbi:hypothetical protein LWI29_025298 [Acer saccharum]|uniref:Gnk2-homologous domain-containing protein n=1 Tax=Acer saccharum TaxID=4024 RepID=A0AA39VI47_ACESA|nr:hypothetical protein LWI29_025298 [Acer saccharum]